ncbi:MobF family relaxase [Kribbella sp. VKM Ac-2566]|uniref:MobF family relaxase n=1 Tax=Kribbella sp. VKM Ac-2566 TaxID=2512218 RepID=UPI001062EADA|nr:MobF family relaxase [Kribbella sp. VKM Ac-2566]TDX04032.1 conjugative relaxase-like TrwC/TraI family protein [Kribbella sp. VKM Ac-2566]
MLSIHRLTAGDGYKYLLRHIASGDLDRRMATALTTYYTASGYPSGRWMGSGLSGLGAGELIPGSEVSEEQMAALFGRAQDPLTGLPLGRPYPTFKSPSVRIQDQIRALDPCLSESERQVEIEQIRKREMRQKTQQAVAGFDLTFSPVKSVSALWATTDVGTQEQIVAAHQDAIRDVLELIEQHAAFTRTGDHGVAQLDVRGLIAAAFDHWDTRSGDPQLHTHVVIANRVQGVDGDWRTVDSRTLHRSIVAMSEIHNVFVADNLSRRLGANWELRERGSQRNPAFEIDAVPDELIREFSSRTEQIETNLAALLDERGDHIQPPSRREMYVLRQQATLMNRPPKHLTKPLAALMAQWRARADQAIGSDAVSAIQRSLEQAGDRPLAAADLSPETIDAYGGATVLAIQNKRATWNRWNLLAEAARQTRLLRIVSSSERFAVLQSVVQCAERHSISLKAPNLVSAPVTRANGESVYTIHNGQIYTSPVILGAESLLLELARDSAGPTIPAPHSAGLSADKVRALHRIATSGQKLEALVGPAGTGKTSLLSALATSWELAHGEGSVIALAPSSAASTILSDAIGISTENIAKWIYESAGLGAEQRRDMIQQTEYAANLAHGDRRKRRHQRLMTQLAALHANHDKWNFRTNQLVIVDEASMASTMELATLARAANIAGAKLLLVGDDAQLSAADTGGAFRLIAKDTQAAELTDVWRFTNPWERDASLALRGGDLTAIDMYDDHNRLTAGSSEDMEDAAYKAWLADTRTGRTSLLVAADNTTVARLNARARLDRITTGEVEPDGIELHNGNHVGLGDHIVTRLNNRRLRYGSNNYVKNGDRWTVIYRWPDGSLTVQNHSGDTVTLPSSYVQESVELAYATTAHRAQGSTVDTAHLVVTENLTRALMYVGMTRGRHTNTAYVATHETTSDLHEPHPEQTMQDVLEAVLNDPGVERSAHEVMRQELDNATRLDRLVPIHEHLCQLDARRRYRPAITTSGLDPADQVALQAAPAYGAFIAQLRRAENAGIDVPELLRRAVNQAPTADAHDLAAVLHARVERLTARSRRQNSAPEIAGLVVPAKHVNDPTLIAPLRELEAQIAQRADWLAAKVANERPIWHQRLVHSLPGTIGLVRDIAAYRERYGVDSPAPLGAAPSRNQIVQRRHYDRLLSYFREARAAAVEWHHGGTLPMHEADR